MIKPKISDMLNYYAAHAEFTSEASSNPEPHQFGYVMGATGEVATLEVLTERAKTMYPDEWESRLSRSKKWLGRRIYDCQGTFDAFVNDTNKAKVVNILSKDNYAKWCTKDNKSSSIPDAKLTKLPQMPGVAVYKGKTADTISHIGVLLFKYGSGYRDWYVLEARGVDYGMVIRKLSATDWTFWGIMDTMYIYDCDVNWFPNFASTIIPSKDITAASVADDVRWAQTRLNFHGANVVVSGKFDAATSAAWSAFAIKRFPKFNKTKIGKDGRAALAES